MNKTLPIQLCIIMLLVVSIIGFTSFLGEAQAPTSEIIVEDADYVSLNATEYSPDLINIAGNVTPRVVVEYGESLVIMGLYDSVELKQAAGIVSPRMVVEYADSIFEYGLQGVTVPNIASRIIVEYADSIFEQNLQRSQNLIEKANIVKPRIIVEYADSIFSADLERPFVTTVTGVEKSSVESSLVEGLMAQKATLNNVLVSGDFNGTVNFTNLEIVSITTGPFTSKGFSKGTWEATLEGVPYKGDWGGALFLKPSERKIYLKGSVSGEISGTVEGYLTESVPGNGIYDQYQATWKIGSIGGKTISAIINLNGTLTYQSDSSFPATELYVLQTSIDGTSIGHYNGPLSTVITHLRIVNGTPYNGEGFSMISYTSNLGDGEGWTYDKLVSPGIVKLKGLFADSLFGTISATLDGSKLPRTLIVTIERVDLGLPPMANLKVKTQGPERVSPGETITYTAELRNDGLKSAENVTLVINLPYVVKYVSSTGSGVYDSKSHKVIWRLENVPPKSMRLFATTVTVAWGLSPGTILIPIASVPIKETEVQVDPTVSIVDEILEATESLVRMKSHISNQSTSGTLEMEVFSATVAEEIEPTFQHIEEENEVTITFQFTIKGFSWRKIWGTIKGLKTAFQVRDIANDARDISRYVIEIQDLLDFAFQKGMLTPETYADFSDLASDTAHVELVIPHALRQFPLFGDLYYQETKAVFKGVNWFFRIHLEKAIQIEYDPEFRLEDLYKLYLEEKSYDMSSAQSEVAVARDPNMKFGPERYISPGHILTYKVEYENEGEGIAFGVYFTDTLDEDLDDSTLEIGPLISTKNGSVIAGPGTYSPSTRTITWLVGEVGSDEGGYANFSVKIRNEAPEGTEIINFATVHFPSVPETTRTNAIVSIVGQPDIAIKKFAPSEIVIDKGLTLCINVTVANEGYLAETFNLTIYANTTLIHTQNVTLIGRSNDTVIFLWNTTDFTVGNYTITAYVSPLPSEIDTNDNTLTFFPAQVIPEFPSILILPLFMMATSIATILLKKKRKTKPQLP